MHEIDVNSPLRVETHLQIEGNISLINHTTEQDTQELLRTTNLSTIVSCMHGN